MLATSPQLTTDLAARKAKVLVILRSLASSVVINGVLPIVIYQLLKSYTHVSELLALFASGVPSMIDAIAGVIRKGRIDLLAGIVLAGIAISIGLVLLGGSPKIFLVRESLFTGAFGIAYLLSLLFPKPLAFYFGRQFAAGNNSMNVTEFNALWQYPYFRFTMRLTTIVWGLGFTLEAIVRIFLVFALTVPQFLVISPFVFYGFLGSLMLWTFLYTRHSRRRGEEMRMQRLATQSPGEAPAS